LISLCSILSHSEFLWVLEWYRLISLLSRCIEDGLLRFAWNRFLWISSLYQGHKNHRLSWKRSIVLARYPVSTRFLWDFKDGSSAWTHWLSFYRRLSLFILLGMTDCPIKGIIKADSSLLSVLLEFYQVFYSRNLKLSSFFSAFRWYLKFEHSANLLKCSKRVIVLI